MSDVQPTGLLYEMIVQDIRRKVESGELTAGDRISSIGELCAHYQVSPITAKRAISELQALGLIHSVRGKGSFVTSQSQAPAAAPPTPRQITRLALVTSSNLAVRSRSFFTEIWDSIQAAAAAAKLEFRVQVIPDGVYDRHMDVIFRPLPDEGLIFLAPTHAGRIVPLVQARASATIMIDVALPFTDCVLTDNLDGMRQLIDHLKALGHQRLYLGSGHPYASNATNENERIAAFRFLCDDRGLHGQIGPVDPDHVLALVRQRGGPTAVLFTRDDPAIDLLQRAKQAGLRVPQDLSITGFDGWAYHPDTTLTTIKVDRAGLGRAAVTQLCRVKPAEPHVNQWIRVPGELVVGTTSGRAPRS